LDGQLPVSTYKNSLGEGVFGMAKRGGGGWSTCIGVVENVGLAVQPKALVKLQGTAVGVGRSTNA